MDIKYTFKKSQRSKSIRISINNQGAVAVTSPFFVPQYFVSRFLNRKKDWIISHLKKINANQPGIIIPRRHGQAYLKYKENARQLVLEAIKKYNSAYNFKYNQVRIKNQKSRWGSCSKKGNLNFSYRLIHLPIRLAEYIVVHELCHLTEFNHSRKFWDSVQLTFPDYKILRKQLKRCD